MAAVPQAHGLAFSVPAGVRVPPSLRNIYKEIEAEYGRKLSAGSGNLEGWAQQGVLLLNTVLTVEQGQAASHARRGWERITDCLLEHLARVGHARVFMLWGSHAQAKRALLPEGHLVLEAPHPSPLSAHRGFLGAGISGPPTTGWRRRGSRRSIGSGPRRTDAADKQPDGKRFPTFLACKRHFSFTIGAKGLHDRMYV